MVKLLYAKTLPVMKRTGTSNPICFYQGFETLYTCYKVDSVRMIVYDDVFPGDSRFIRRLVLVHHTTV